MVVNEDNLIVLLRSINALIAGYNEQKNQAITLNYGLKKIQLKNGELPFDQDTGQTMTQARRDEIYDKCLDAANDLLGIDSD